MSFDVPLGETIERLTSILGRSALTQDFFKFFQAVVALPISETLMRTDPNPSEDQDSVRKFLCEFEEKFARQIIRELHKVGPPAHRIFGGFDFKRVTRIARSVESSVGAIREAAIEGMPLIFRTQIRAPLREFGINHFHEVRSPQRRVSCLLSENNSVNVYHIHMFDSTIINAIILNIQESLLLRCLFDTGALDVLDIERSFFKDCTIIGWNFSQRVKTLEERSGLANVGRVTFEGCTLRRCTFERTVFEQAAFRDCMFEGVEFNDCIFEKNGVDISGNGFRIRNARLFERTNDVVYVPAAESDLRNAGLTVIMPMVSSVEFWE
jgi:hypothetical protein